MIDKLSTMFTMEETKQALEEAIGRAGGISAFAAKIGAPSIGAVKGWKRTGSIPADYCPAIECFTGVVCERLRPRVGWGYLRNSASKNPAALPSSQAQAAIKPVAQGVA